MNTLFREVMILCVRFLKIREKSNHRLFAKCAAAYAPCRASCTPLCDNISGSTAYADREYCTLVEKYATRLEADIASI